jgi:AcrR family transcriptional regulator
MDAVIDLVEAGHPAPTARRVASRAGVAVRTVFHHFDGVDDLFAQAVDRRLARIWSSIAPVPPRGPLEVRIAIVVRQRRRLFEATGPVLQAAYARAATTPALARVLDGHRWALQQQLVRSLAPELDGRLAPGLLTTVGAVSGWSQWSTLRFEEGQSAPQAERTMVLLVSGVLARATG